MACSCGVSCERDLRYSDQLNVSADSERNWRCVTTDRDSARDSSSETGMIDVEFSARLLRAALIQSSTFR